MPHAGRTGPVGQAVLFGGPERLCDSLTVWVLLGALWMLSGLGCRKKRRGDGLRDYIERKEKIGNV
jgi:hypothetical protein